MSVSIDLEDDRYHRQSLITWWDQATLAAARVLVVGAGALGNEIVKCLTLTGVGHLTVVDMDTIENSNLARCVLFRPGDEGRHKAAIVAERAAELNTDVDIAAIVGRVEQLGLGDVAGFDVVIGGLDNREARVWVNQACRKLGITWIDGAIEGIRGTVRVFTPEGPCYECTLGEVDRKILSRRKSCALLDVEDVVAGKVPTTATSASWVAAVQAQEAIKLLHGRDELLALRNEGITYIGETLDVFRVSYHEDEWCLAHDTYGDLEEVAVGPEDTLRSLVDRIGMPLATVEAFDLESEVIVGATCHACDRRLGLVGSTVSLRADEAKCPGCDDLPALDVVRSVGPDEELAGRPLQDLRLPERDVVTVRSVDARRHVVVVPT